MEILRFILRILFAILFTENQRKAIIEALEYSRLTYERRGKKEEAAKVSKVLNYVTSLKKVKKQKEKTFTIHELKEAIDKVLREVNIEFEKILAVARTQSYNEGVKESVPTAYDKGFDDATLEIFFDLKMAGVDISKLIPDEDEIVFFDRMFKHMDIIVTGKQIGRAHV